MSLLDIILLAVALAMDCLTVSVVSGVLKRSLPGGCIVRMAFLFGFFQALMPLIGWLGISHFQSYMEAYDHWIAFSLLAFIGGRMVRESFHPEEGQHFDPSRLRTQLLLAVATSIDALAVGVSFAFLGASPGLPVCVIGITTALFSAVGILVGKKVGSRFHKGAGILGGIILIALGIKILVEHLFL